MARKDNSYVADSKYCTLDNATFKVQFECERTDEKKISG